MVILFTRFLVNYTLTIQILALRCGFRPLDDICSRQDTLTKERIASNIIGILLNAVLLIFYFKLQRYPFPNF
jgi:hypothetical protein